MPRIFQYRQGETQCNEEREREGDIERGEREREIKDHVMYYYSSIKYAKFHIRHWFHVVLNRNIQYLSSWTRHYTTIFRWVDAETVSLSIEFINISNIASSVFV